MLTLADTLKGRREYLEQFMKFHEDPGTRQIMKEAALSAVDALQGMGPQHVFDRVRADYNSYLAQAVNMQEKASNPAACDLQISYLQGELRKLRDWKEAGLPE